MTTIARPRLDEIPLVECVHNRELMVPIKEDQLFFVMSEDVNKKFGIDYDLGEMLIYSPKFEEHLACLWVAQTIDFDFLDLDTNR